MFVSIRHVSCTMKKAIMPDAKVLRREIESVLEPDRAATDASLCDEREHADAAIEEQTDRKLEHTRAVVDEELTGPLPLLAQALRPIRCPKWPIRWWSRPKRSLTRRMDWRRRRCS